MSNIGNDAGTAPHLRRKLGNRTISQVSTPASGSNGTQFIFKDAAGVPMATPVAGLAYLASDAAGLTPVAANTSIAVLTNGAMASAGATALKGPFFHYVTTAAGLLGLTVTATAGAYYLAFVQPSGDVTVSSVITIN